MTDPAAAPRRNLRDRVPRSVRARITALAAVLLAIVLAVASVIVVVAQREALLDGVDDNLRLRADDLESLISATPGASDLLPATSTDTVAQLVSGSGDVVAASHPSVRQEQLAPPPGEGVTESIISVDSLPVDDDEFRVLSRRLDDGSVLHVADAVDDIREGIAALARALLLATIGATVVLAAIVWWLIGRTLRPVESIRAEVAAMAGEDLHRRVPEPSADDEIGRLARTMNEMLGRVEEAQVRQRRFAADASHELRSPLARIRTELEVDLAHPEGIDPFATHRSVLDETEVLQRMIDDLLVLARGEQQLSPGTATLDLDDIVLRETEALRRRDGLTLDVGEVSAAQVRGDEIQLTRAVRNLVDNAVRHARSRVHLTLREADDVARLTIADDGPGIPAADHERVFERFTRLDDARSRPDGGSGLGLAISREIVARHGGTLTIDADHADGAKLVLELPLAAQ